MRTALALALALMFVASSPALAVELGLGWAGRVGWDSNVFRSSNNEESDFSGAMGPEVRLRERSRAFDLALEYRMFYEEFADLRGLGSFEHRLTTDATWRATPRDSFSLDQSFTRTDSLLQLVETGVTGVASDRLAQDRQTITRNFVSGRYLRQLSPLWQLSVNGSNANYWYENPRSSDSRSTSGSADVTYTLSLRHRLGGGVAYTQQEFEDTDFTNGSRTSFVQVYGIWSYEISRTLSFSSSVGPRLAIPDDLEDTAPASTVALRGTPFGPVSVSPNGCPVFRPGVVRLTGDCQLASLVRIDPSSVPVRDLAFLDGREEPSENFGFFGRLSLAKRWEHVTATLSYERSASSSSGLAAATDLDVVSLRADWRPRRDWRVIGIAAWEHQVSSSEIPRNELLLSSTPTTLFVDADGRLVDAPVPGGQTINGAAQVIGLRTAELVDNAIDIQATRLELRVQHDFTPRVSLNGLVMWWRQQAEGDFQADDVVNAARVELTLTWRFAPIDL